MTIEQLERDRAALPAALDLLNLPGSVAEAMRLESRKLDARIQVARAAIETLSQLDPQLVSFERQHVDLMAIRDEIAAELLTCPPHAATRTGMNALQGLKISIQIIDGRFDIANEMIPTPLPLFEKLNARGFIGPAHAPWNPMAALFGSLPNIERRLAELRKQRDQAQERLDLVLRDSVTV